MEGREVRKGRKRVEGKGGKKEGVEQVTASRDQGRTQRWRYHLRG